MSDNPDSKTRYPNWAGDKHSYDYAISILDLHYGKEPHSERVVFQTYVNIKHDADRESDYK